MILFVSHAGAISGGELTILDLLKDGDVPGKVAVFSDGPIVERLRSNKISVEVMKGAKRLLDLKRKRIGSALLAGGAICRLVGQLVRYSSDCDAICAASQKALLPCALAATLSGKKLIWWLHDYLDPAEFSAIALRIQIAIANCSASLVISNSEATSASFVALHGAKAKVRVVHLGISSSIIDAVDDNTVAAIRAAHQLDGKFVIGCFSRLAPWKGQDNLLECIAGLPGHTHLLLVGTALFGEAEYERSLRLRVQQLGISDRVTFAGFQEFVAPYLKSCDLIVHASTAPEGFGRVIVEGMLARRPVIAVDMAGPKEIIRDGVSGLLVPINDTNALKAAITRIMENPTEGRMLADAGWRRAQRDFSLTLFRANWIDTTNELVKGRN